MYLLWGASVAYQKDYTLSRCSAQVSEGPGRRDNNTLTLTPLHTPEIGIQRVPCQLNGYAWKEVHTMLPYGDMIDLTSDHACVKFF
ncbi:hypothetical protein AVEN_96213-1 [Araneus ventricosus]|uniref:Uncharacterized protein n=1 Tax=Araneus ventricosus TaxID=182803 RepID=A0A4Y2I3G5_ARAVE|nr:hypothetical protein AVEN_96213-1 [Araneus ventricosus]